MTLTENETVTRVRGQYPLVANDDILYLNASYQPPMNNIVANSIQKYIDRGLHDSNPKPEWIDECEIVRGKIANFIGANPEDMVFTRDTTEACNLFQRSLNFKAGDNVVLLRGEHPNQTAGWLGLIPQGLTVKFVDVDESLPMSYNAATFKDTVNADTIAIGISSIMFHSGLRNDIKSICDEYRPKGIQVLVDATQEVGFGKIDVKELGVSAIAFGIHKGLSCPTGLGLLYIDPTVIPSLKETPPIMSAGSLSNITSSLITPTPYKCFDSARKYEHLNKALLQCLALGDYIDFVNEIGMETIQAYLESLGIYLRSKMNEIGVNVIGPHDVGSRSPHSNVLELMSPSWVQFFLDNNVFISQYRAGVRVSLGSYNSKEDIDKFTLVVKKGIELGLK